MLATSVRLGVVEYADVGAGELVAEVRHDVPERAEQARRRGHDHRERAHDPGNGVRVHRPRPAVGNERELARVMASLDGDDPQRARHVLVDDGEDALGSVLDRRQAHGIGDRLHRRPGGLHIELHLAAEQLRGEVADDDVRVGDGGIGAALAIRGGTGLCAGRLRADAQRLRQLRHVGDRPAAGANGVDVDGGHAQAEVADRRLAPDRRSATEAERHVGRRPAHVEREDVVVAGLARHVERARDAAGRPGEDAVDRVPRRLARRHQPRVRAEDVDVRRRADGLQLRLELLDVARDLRPHVRVHACGQRPLVLAELGQHVRRERDREARVQALDDLAHLLLVPARDVRVDEADRQSLDAGLDEVADSLFGLLHVDGRHGVAPRVHPLDDLARVGERGRRVGLDHDDPARERPGRLRACEVEDLLEADRRQQADAGALRLEHGVRRHGRAVKDVADVGNGRACLVRDAPDTDEHAL